MTRIVCAHGISLRLAILPGENGFPFIVSIQSVEPQDEVIAETLASAWWRGPSDIFKNIRERSGAGWEGQVSYSYHDPADDDGIPPSAVRVSYMDEERLLPAAAFEALVEAIARFHLDAAKCQAADGSTEKDIRSWLERRN